MKIENNSEKEVKAKLKSEITEETTTKNQISKSALAGLIISGIGGVLYFLIGFLMVNPSEFSHCLTIPCLIAGAISVTGLIIGRYKVKIGGIILLTPIPIAFLIGTVLIFILYGDISGWTVMILSEIVFSIGILVLIGAILLIASKKP